MSKCRISLDSYTKLLRNGFSTLQQSEEFVDMTLAADGHLVKVHKNLVALASPFIKEMIQSAPCAHPVIFLANISKQVLSYILEYIYTGEVDVPRENVDALVKAGKLLHIYGLETMTPPLPMYHNATQRQHNPDSDQSSNQKNRSNIMYQYADIDIDRVSAKLSETNPTNKLVAEEVIDLSGQMTNNCDLQTDDVSVIISTNNSQEDINNDDYTNQTSELNGQGNDIRGCDHQLLAANDTEMQSENNECVTNSYPKITVSLDSQDPSNANIQIECTKDLSHTKKDEAGPTIYYTLSTKDSIILVVNRYMYNLHHTSGGGRKNRWRCTDYRRNGCKAYIDTFDENLVARKFNHLHPMHDEKIVRRGDKHGTFSSKQEAVESLAERAKMKSVEFKDSD